MSFLGASVCTIVREDNQYRQFFVMFGVLLKLLTFIFLVVDYLVAQQQAAEEAANQNQHIPTDNENAHRQRGRSNYARPPLRTVFRRLSEIHPIAN